MLYLNNVETYITDDLRVEFIDEMLKTHKNFDTDADAAISLLRTLF